MGAHLMQSWAHSARLLVITPWHETLLEARHVTMRVTKLQLENYRFGKISMQDTSVLKNKGTADVLYP